MKKQIYCALLICLLASLVGCQKEEESVTTEQAESYEHIEQFPEVIDIASYLEVEAEEVNVLNEETDRLVFCFHHEEDSQTTPSIKSYEQLLIDDDYTAEYGSATLYQSDTFTNGQYEILIVQISPDEGALEEWKEIHRNTIDTEKMQDENVVFEVKVMS